MWEILFQMTSKIKKDYVFVSLSNAATTKVVNKGKTCGIDREGI